MGSNASTAPCTLAGVRATCFVLSTQKLREAVLVLIGKQSDNDMGPTAILVALETPTLKNHPVIQCSEESSGKSGAITTSAE